VSRGDHYSRANDTYGALLISKDNKAWIATPPIKTGNAYNAVGGFRLLLKNGQNVATHDIRHPRTAAGISKDGRVLYLVVLDGRQKSYSEGATTAETAEWMTSFGAWEALNLDGGGSTALAISDGHGGAKILNRPIHLGLPGTERVVANHLGIMAKPLPKAASAP
jgi:exopolysaccharide biosynthesis protein